MTALLKFLLIAIAILWLIRVLARLLFPWVMRELTQRMMKDAQRQYQRHSGTQQQRGGRQPKPDGEIRIDYVPPQAKSKRGAKRAGEFVEFEEIKSSAE
ncbi:DUF4834 family protein [Parapedobacter composti]|nr:DUF4834 family protein [Parapedobacter composti]